MIVATLASLSTREALLERTLATLLPQVDAVCVYLNGYRTVPRSLVHPKVVHALLSTEMGLRGGEAKLFFWDRDLFKAAPIWRPDDVAIVVDDDILYPPDYVARLIASLDAHPGSIACVHGSVLADPFERYAASRWVASARGSLAETSRVQIPGTGTMAFRAGSFAVSLREHFPWSHCVDVCVGIQAKAQGVECWSVARPDGWLQPMQLPKGTSIYRQRTGAGNDAVETKLIVDAGPWPSLEHDVAGFKKRAMTRAGERPIVARVPARNPKAMLPAEVPHWVGGRLAAMKARGTVVELGSGHGSAVLAAALPSSCRLMSIEHDERFLNLTTSSSYVHAPIAQGWYDAAKVRASLPHDIVALVVDGPPGSLGNGRLGLLDHLDLFQALVPMIIDDVNRPAEAQLANEIGRRRGQPVHIHQLGGGRAFAVIGWPS